MSDRSIVAVAVSASGEILLRAPKVGVFTVSVPDGSLVSPGAAIGTLRHLGRSQAVVAPSGAAGRVVLADRGRGAVAVGYGEVLLRLIAVGDLSPLGSEPAKAAQIAGSALAVTAPTAGVFYRAPGANARPFVSAGDKIRKGQPVGLIEVMKTFNPIPYEGDGLPDEAEVVEVLAADGAEVRAGQALVAVKTL